MVCTRTPPGGGGDGKACEETQVAVSPQECLRGPSGVLRRPVRSLTFTLQFYR